MLVMISGKQGSGKTSVADRLQEYWGRRGIAIYRSKFAGPLYELKQGVHALAKQFPALAALIADDPKDGRLLQLLGDWGREKDPNVWVDCARHQTSKITDNWKDKGLHFIVIRDDLRFKNEFDGEPDALKVRLECDRGKRKGRTTSWRETDTHISETDLDDYLDKFHLILNTGELTLDETVNKIVEYYNEKMSGVFKN